MALPMFNFVWAFLDVFGTPLIAIAGLCALGKHLHDRQGREAGPD